MISRQPGGRGVATPDQTRIFLQAKQSFSTEPFYKQSSLLQAKQSRWVTKCQERSGGTIHSVKPILQCSFAFTLWMVPWPWMSTFSLRRSSWQAWRAKPGPVKVVTKICTFKALKKVTLQGTNISHLGKRKIIFKMPFLGDMLVPTRVSLVIFFSWLNAIIVNSSTESKVGQTLNGKKPKKSTGSVRSGKHEANKALLYKIWPLWQKIATRTVFVRVRNPAAGWKLDEANKNERLGHSGLLRPFSIIFHPAKRRVLATQRARKAQYDFGGEWHSDLQRVGNTKRARFLLNVYIKLKGGNGQFRFLLNSLTAHS